MLQHILINSHERAGENCSAATLNIMIFHCHRFELPCSVLLVNRALVRSPTLPANPTLFVIPRNFFVGL